MRDFEQEVSNAAGPLPPIQTEEFSWSLARHYLFRFCRRAYFIRYYLAQGGWDAYSHTLAREAYFSKYLMPFDTWLSRTLRDSIREAFAKMSAGSPGHKRRGFGFYLLRQIGKATADLQMSLKNREYLYDAKRPAILEHHLGIGDFADVDKLTDMAVSILGDAYAMLSRSDIIADLANISFVDLRTDDVFISVDYNGFPVWLVPGLIYFHEGAACAIDAEVRLTGGEKTTDFFARKRLLRPDRPPELALRPLLRQALPRIPRQHHHVHLLAGTLQRGLQPLRTRHRIPDRQEQRGDACAHRQGRPRPPRGLPALRKPRRLPHLPLPVRVSPPRKRHAGQTGLSPR